MSGRWDEDLKQLEGILNTALPTSGWNSSASMRHSPSRSSTRTASKLAGRTESENGPGSTPSPTMMSDNNELVVLDGFMLLDACHVEFPDEASQVALCSLGISDIVEDDLQYFTSLYSIDLSDNQVCVHQTMIMLSFLSGNRRLPSNLFLNCLAWPSYFFNAMV